VFEERRDSATQAVTNRLRGLKLRIFRKVLGWAQWLAPLREDGIAGLGLGYPQIRKMLLELGRRFAEAGAIGVAADVFWLLRDEVAEAAKALDRGDVPRSSLEDVRLRKASWRAAKRVTPPPQLPPSKKWMGINMAAFLPQDAESQVGEVLKGLGASPGRATGIARVLGGPSDFQQMRPRDVLVAAITTPAWTPLFAMASAIVTDVGGPLSHGSIVAREYGIPAVLGTGVATRRIQSGRVITVDGSAGLVHLGEAAS
jgi:pyruvate,water dikinase